MKTLLILRHAKSSRDDPGLDDHERPLNPRGLKDAPRMGQTLHEQGLLPDIVLSSTARRARHTAELAAETCGYKAEIHLRRDLYSFDAGPYLQALAELPDDIQSAMIVGHNPAMEEILAKLTGKVQPVPTAALVHIELPVQAWQELNGRVRGKLLHIWRPKEL